MKIETYNRLNAINYAKDWALKRNEKYYDFSNIDGDCTNFVSQCLYAGAPVMNYTVDLGWYYRNSNDKSPAWTGVEYFYNFLIKNNLNNGIGNGYGPFAEETSLQKTEIGDFIQLGNNNNYFHNVIIVGYQNNGIPLIASHSRDVYGAPITIFNFNRYRCLHVLGVKKQ